MQASYPNQQERARKFHRVAGGAAGGPLWDRHLVDILAMSQIGQIKELRREPPLHRLTRMLSWIGLETPTWSPTGPQVGPMAIPRDIFMRPSPANVIYCAHVASVRGRSTFATMSTRTMPDPCWWRGISRTLR